MTSQVSFITLARIAPEAKVFLRKDFRQVERKSGKTGSGSSNFVKDHKYSGNILQLFESGAAEAKIEQKLNQNKFWNWSIFEKKAE